MATVICMGGLGGHPETMFGSLKKVLEQDGHRVAIADTSRVRSHEDRVQLVLKHHQSCDSGENVFFIGHSAGAIAACVAAGQLERSGKHLSGAILLSPAMPRGIFFMTRPLWQVMRGRLYDLLFGTTFTPTEEEYGRLVSPLPEEMRKEVLGSRQLISGREARELAFYPPRFVGYSAPTFHIFGTEDRWIAPSAQRRFNKMIRRARVTTHEVAGAGHLILASHKREEVRQMIRGWIADLSS